MIVAETGLQKKLQSLIDNKTKPLGALGRLEELALQIGMIQDTVHPQLDHPHIVVFAGDHGIAATGLINPYPQAVTAQMVLNFLRGGAAINVFCRQHGLGLQVVDAGVNFDFTDEPSSGKLIHAKVSYGTRNYLEEDAMSREETLRAIASGKKIVEDLHDAGCNCVGFGEMGIGNTSAASLIMSYVTGIPVEACVGRGTGVNDEQLEQKKTTLRTAFRLHQAALSQNEQPQQAQGKPAQQAQNEPAQQDPGSPGQRVTTAAPELILQHVGGFEIAMMVGAYWKAAELKMIILVDGFITTAALLLARLSDPEVQRHCIFSHRSGEQGHERMLEYLGAHPLLNLGMRLGEGTGAAMAFPVVQSAVHFLREMASFESAGVSRE